MAYHCSGVELERRNRKIAVTLFWLSRIAPQLPPFGEYEDFSEEVSETTEIIITPPNEKTETEKCDKENCVGESIKVR